MLDMLGRAKWDAWAKVRGLPSRDAKQMYVESMLRVSTRPSRPTLPLSDQSTNIFFSLQILRRFADRPQAMALIEELESFSGQVAQRVMDGETRLSPSATPSDYRFG